MARKISIEEWEKNRGGRQNPIVQHRGSKLGSFEAKRGKRFSTGAVVLGFLGGAAIAAALGFYFYQDFSRWWIEGGVVGAAYVFFRTLISVIRKNL